MTKKLKKKKKFGESSFEYRGKSFNLVIFSTRNLITNCVSTSYKIYERIKYL